MKPVGLVYKTRSDSGDLSVMGTPPRNFMVLKELTHKPLAYLISSSLCLYSYFMGRMRFCKLVYRRSILLVISLWVFSEIFCSWNMIYGIIFRVINFIPWTHWLHNLKTSLILLKKGSLITKIQTFLWRYYLNTCINLFKIL